MGVVRRQISRHAARLRRERTDAEDAIWQRLRDRQLGGFKFRFQHTVAGYLPDFTCLEAMLIVEIDGSQHGGEADRERTTALERRGFEVLRFWNSDVLANLDGVLEVVLAAAQKRVEEGRRPSPHPLPQAGEG